MGPKFKYQKYDGHVDIAPSSARDAAATIKIGILYSEAEKRLEAVGLKDRGCGGLDMEKPSDDRDLHVFYYNENSALFIGTDKKTILGISTTEGMNKPKNSWIDRELELLILGDKTTPIRYFQKKKSVPQSLPPVKVRSDAEAP